MIRLLEFAPYNCKPCLHTHAHTLCYTVLAIKVEGLFCEMRGSQASHTELFIAAFTRKFTANTGGKKIIINPSLRSQKCETHKTIKTSSCERSVIKRCKNKRTTKKIKNPSADVCVFHLIRAMMSTDQN